MDKNGRLPLRVMDTPAVSGKTWRVSVRERGRIVTAVYRVKKHGTLSCTDEGGRLSLLACYPAPDRFAHKKYSGRLGLPRFRLTPYEICL